MSDKLSILVQQIDNTFWNWHVIRGKDYEDKNITNYTFSGYYDVEDSNQSFEIMVQGNSLEEVLSKAMEEWNKKH